MSSCDRPPYSCARCQTRYITERAYDVHVRVSLDHHVCVVCTDGKDFESFIALQNHYEESHFFCEPCGWAAPSALGLRQHNTSKHFLCVACGDYFLNPHELNGVCGNPFWHFMRLFFFFWLKLIRGVVI